jgi:uncharacterized protein (TIGR03435 family)
MTRSRVLTAVAIYLFTIEATHLWGAEAFEVASVKPSRSGSNGVSGGCHGIDSVLTPAQRAEAAPLGRCVINDARLAHLVNIAWGLETMQMIESGPDWIQRGIECFDVVAKAEDPSKATEQQLLTMLQNLLVERFQMKFHRRPAETSGFALTVAKNGPHLDASKSEDSDLSLGKGKDKPSAGQPVALRVRRFSMPMLVKYLSSFGGQGPGIDKTGLDGVYDFTLSWDDDAGPTLPAALREQLGLRMEAQKVPISYFIIDSAQRPSAN